jgi:hypothetical protein
VTPPWAHGVTVFFDIAVFSDIAVRSTSMKPSASCALQIDGVKERVGNGLPVSALPRPHLGRAHQGGPDAVPPHISINIPTFQLRHRAWITSVGVQTGAVNPASPWRSARCATRTAASAAASHTAMSI